ncbi:unnamed protein product [Paramecium octaurelia]|uniref:Uncharacterized protein n=1 Tax=Paramecium octaurelia TaxID=43137 RepID=A0A8S1YJM6_PAROT|nr:unnamed protein product [Paramecium octaurelia]
MLQVQVVLKRWHFDFYFALEEGMFDEAEIICLNSCLEGQAKLEVLN